MFTFPCSAHVWSFHRRGEWIQEWIGQQNYGAVTYLQKLDGHNRNVAPGDLYDFNSEAWYQLCRHWWRQSWYRDDFRFSVHIIASVMGHLRRSLYSTLKFLKKSPKDAPVGALWGVFVNESTILSCSTVWRPCSGRLWYMKSQYWEKIKCPQVSCCVFMKWHLDKPYELLIRFMS